MQPPQAPVSPAGPAPAQPETPIKIRARVSSIIEDLEKQVAQRNVRGVRTLTEALKSELQQSPAPALEAGAVQALLGALNYTWKDAVVTETVFQAVLLLGRRVQLSATSSVSPAALARIDGILLLVRVGGEYKSNAKIRASIVSILRLFALDETGARLVLWAGGVPLLLDACESPDRLLVTAACGALAAINLWHLGARSATARGVEQLLQASRRFKTDTEVLEQTLACLCLVSQLKSGAMGVLLVSPASKPSSNAFSEAAALALDTLKHLDHVPGAGASLTPAGAGTTPSKHPPPGGASAGVVVGHERRCQAWAMMLLHNLALFGDQVLRADLFSGFAALDLGQRDLGGRILDRMRVMIEEPEVAAGAAEEPDHQPDLPPAPLAVAQALVLRVAGLGPAADVEGEEDESMCFAVLLGCEFLSRTLQVGFAELLHASKLVLQRVVVAAQRGPLPVSTAGVRVLSLLHVMHNHPVVKRGFDARGVAASRELIEFVKTLDPPEYFTPVARSLDASLAAALSQDVVPYRRFPLVLSFAAGAAGSSTPPPSSPLKPPKPVDLRPALDPELLQDGGGDGLWDWSAQPPEELVRQFTLRMERLYLAIDPRLIYPGSEHAPLAKFTAYHADLVDFFQARVLSRPTPAARAEAIEYLVRMAAHAATTLVSNLDLTMAVLQALQRPGVARLGRSWRLCARAEAQRLDELLRLANFEDALRPGVLAAPPPLLRCPSVPFVQGCLLAMPAELTADSLRAHYKVLSGWLPLLGRNGDWYARPHAFVIEPAIQMHLARLGVAGHFDAAAASQSLEPDWSQAQLVSECEMRVHALVEAWLLLEAKDAAGPASALGRFRAKPSSAVDAVEAGRVAREVARAMLSERREQILERTGVRTEAHWDVFARRVRLVVEQHVLAHCSGALALRSMLDSEAREMELGIRIAALRAAPVAEQARFLGIANAEPLAWRGAVCAMAAMNQAAAAPSQMLQVLLRVKDEIFAEAGASGTRDMMSADDLLPVLALVVSRAQLESPLAKCAFIRDFMGDDMLDQGESGYYFVSFDMALRLCAGFRAAEPASSASDAPAAQL